MMSYLWILLLGSLLATGAKAQDEEPGEPGTPVPEADTEPELNGEADEEDEPATEEDPTILIEPEATVEPVAVTPEHDDADPDTLETVDVKPVPSDEDAEPTTAVDDAVPVDEDAEPTTAGGYVQSVPVDEDAEPTAAVDDAVPVDEDAEPTTAGDDVKPVPADEDAEPTTAGDNADLAAPADEDIQPMTPVVDTEAEIAAVVEEPETDPEDGDMVENVEEEPSATADAAPAPEESGPDDQPTSEPDPEVDSEEDPTGSDVTDQFDEDKINPDMGIKIHAAPEDFEDDAFADGSLDLEDALSEPNPHSGKSRSSDPGAQSAVAQGNVDKPQTQKASSGTLAGILCAIGVAAVGAVTGYFTYQRKQLCFKNRQEADPEAARKADAAEAQSEPQVLSNLLDKQ